MHFSGDSLAVGIITAMVILLVIIIGKITYNNLNIRHFTFSTIKYFFLALSIYFYLVVLACWKEIRYEQKNATRPGSSGVRELEMGKA